MKKIIITISSVFILGACTHASISTIPIEIEGVGTVYRYQGRANFPHQIAEADRMISEDCKQKNGGHAVIVDLKKQYLGQVDMGGSESRTRINATVSGTGNYSQVSGTARTTSTGSGTSLANYNQEILYKCVNKNKEDVNQK
jgi:hypothetical protein